MSRELSPNPVMHFEDHKYSLEQLPDGSFKVYRYGKPWHAMQEALVGNKFLWIVFTDMFERFLQDPQETSLVPERRW